MEPSSTFVRLSMISWIPLLCGFCIWSSTGSPPQDLLHIVAINHPCDENFICRKNLSLERDSICIIHVRSSPANHPRLCGCTSYAQLDRKGEVLSESRMNSFRCFQHCTERLMAVAAAAAVDTKLMHRNYSRARS